MRGGEVKFWKVSRKLWTRNRYLALWTDHFSKTLLLKLLFTVAIKLLSGISREYSKFRACFSLLSPTSAFICINMSTFRVSVSYVSSRKTFAIPIDLRYRCFSVFSLHIILCITFQCLIECLDVDQTNQFFYLVGF